MANSAVLQVFTLPLPYWPVWSQELPESSRVQRHDQNSPPPITSSRHQQRESSREATWHQKNLTGSIVPHFKQTLLCFVL